MKPLRFRPRRRLFSKPNNSERTSEKSEKTEEIEETEDIVCEGQAAVEEELGEEKMSTEKESAPYSVEAARIVADKNNKMDDYHKSLIKWLCDQVDELQDQLDIEEEDCQEHFSRIGFYTDLFFQGDESKFPKCEDGYTDDDEVIGGLLKEFQAVVERGLQKKYGTYNFADCKVKFKVEFEVADNDKLEG
jgi:hypothetical protein